jgi:hypothetical protein
MPEIAARTWRRETTGNRDERERTLKGCEAFLDSFDAWSRIPAGMRPLP